MHLIYARATTGSKRIDFKQGKDQKKGVENSKETKPGKWIGKPSHGFLPEIRGVQPQTSKSHASRNSDAIPTSEEHEHASRINEGVLWRTSIDNLTSITSLVNQDRATSIVEQINAQQNVVKNLEQQRETEELYQQVHAKMNDLSK
ncbi:hypothetical protein ACH5RR_015434 [Cinchona calisaya]|uniref:Uncharacterized protein n=1 Tax=Cinchona calisaya TaxID=153742 RepID=A0ABD2ZWM0_9GENT